MLTKEQLKQVLLEQREAVLRKELGIERNILKNIAKKIKLPHIIVITGLRRSGKSTILRQIIKEYYGDKDFYYINFEDERFFNFKAQDFNIIYESLIELFGEKKTFFIDEIQNINGFEGFVRRFYDTGFKFFITGSNAKLFNKEIGTKLTGRHVDIIVKPFSFAEFLSAKKLKFEKSMLYKSGTKAQLKAYFEEYLFKGGMPEYVLYEDPEVLIRVYEDIVIKDVFARYKLDDSKSLKELYQYLITNFSSKFSFNSLTKFIDIKSYNTIKKYIGYLEETYFISVINLFSHSQKKQIANDKKVYVLDNGFIPQISTRLTRDKGWLLENLVFNNFNAMQVFYFESKHECDFVVFDNKKINCAVQVCWELTETNRNREVNGLLAAMKQFKLNKGLLLTSDQEDEILIGKKKIIVKPVWKWLLE